MVVQGKVVITFQRKYGLLDSVSEDDIPDTAMAECLNIMYYTVYPPALQLGLDILQAFLYGVRVGIV